MMPKFKTGKKFRVQRIIYLPPKLLAKLELRRKNFRVQRIIYFPPKLLAKLEPRTSRI
jgi:hypothetical protein